jgi:hypothetical protein
MSRNRRELESRVKFYIDPVKGTIPVRRRLPRPFRVDEQTLNWALWALEQADEAAKQRGNIPEKFDRIRRLPRPGRR